MVLKVEQLRLSSNALLPSHTTRFMYASAHVALERGQYSLCASIVSLLTSEHLNSLNSFLAIERGQHFFTRLAGHLLIEHRTVPLTGDVLEAVTMFIHRLVYHLHKTFEHENTTKSKKQWRLLAKEIHFVAIWIIKMLLQHFFALDRIYEICMSMISPLLPDHAINNPNSMLNGLSGGMSGGMSSSPNIFAPTTPDEMMGGGTTPHALSMGAASSSSSSTSSSSSSSAAAAAAAVDTAAGLKEWWASKDFDTVRRAYTSLAMKAHLTKGGNENDPINEHMKKLLAVMHVNPRDGMGSGKASPGFPGSTIQFGSPLASPVNMTPQYGNSMAPPMPSASPLMNSSQGSTPGSSASPGSSTFDSSPQPGQPSSTPIEHVAPILASEGQPPVKRARVE